MNHSPAPLLKIEGGTKAYGGITVLEDVNFELRAGEIHALVGENGAGKSTLCKAIAGAIALSAGRYLIDGQPVRSASEWLSVSMSLSSGASTIVALPWPRTWFT